VAFGVAVIQFVDLDAVLRELRDSADDSNTDLEVGKLTVLVLGVVVLAAIVYPILQAIVLRWWLAGLRIGPLAVTTTLRERTVVGAYLRCLGYAALMMTALSLLL